MISVFALSSYLIVIPCVIVRKVRIVNSVVTRQLSQAEPRINFVWITFYIHNRFKENPCFWDNGV